MANENITSLTLANFVIGLFDGHVLLRPMSADIMSLNYYIHAVEAKIKTSSYTCRPDALIISKDRHCTLVCEWTAQESANDRKKTQLSNYYGVDANALDSSQFVPPEATTNINVWVLVGVVNVNSYQECIERYLERLLLAELTNSKNGGFTYKGLNGSLHDQETNNMLSGEYSFDNIPKGYISFPLHDLKSIELIDIVCQQLAVFVNEEKWHVKAVEICEEQCPVWELLDIDVQREILRACQKVIREMAKRIKGGWLRSASPRDHSWEIEKSPIGINNMLFNLTSARNALVYEWHKIELTEELPFE